MLFIYLFLTQQEDLLSSSPSTIDKTRRKFLKVLLYVYGIELSELVLGERLLVPLNGVIRLASSYGTVKMKVHQDLITQKSPSAGAPPPPYRSAPATPNRVSPFFSSCLRDNVHYRSTNSKVKQSIS